MSPHRPLEGSTVSAWAAVVPGVMWARPCKYCTHAMARMAVPMPTAQSAAPLTVTMAVLHALVAWRGVAWRRCIEVLSEYDAELAEEGLMEVLRRAQQRLSAGGGGDDGAGGGANPRRNAEECACMFLEVRCGDCPPARVPRRPVLWCHAPPPYTHTHMLTCTL